MSNHEDFETDVLEKHTRHFFDIKTKKGACLIARCSVCDFEWELQCSNKSNIGYVLAIFTEKSLERGWRVLRGRLVCAQCVKAEGVFHKEDEAERNPEGSP